MKKKQKNICFRLEEHTNVLLEVLAEKKGYKSVSEFAKNLLTSEIDYEIKPIEVKLDSTTKKVSTYLYDHEIELLKKHTVLSEMTLSREIALRVRQTLIAEAPCFYLHELHELKKLRTAIDRIGRNVHRIISGDRYVEIDDEEFRKEVNELLKINQEINDYLLSLTNSAINRFG